MGYIVMLANKSKRSSEFFAPMSYGRGEEPAHEKLLWRGRATLFSTEKDAWDALKATLRQATADGDEWPKKFQYSVIECVVSGGVLQPEKRSGHERQGETYNRSP